MNSQEAGAKYPVVLWASVRTLEFQYCFVILSDSFSTMDLSFPAVEWSGYEYGILGQIA